MTEINFIALGGHGSGLNAFNTFINQIPNVHCCYVDDFAKDIKSYFNKAVPVKGILVDTASIAGTEVMVTILRHLSPQCLLILLTRDPVDRLKSVTNTHIQWWGEAVAGTYDMRLQDTMLYNLGNEERLLVRLMELPNMRPLVSLYRNFANVCPHKLFWTIRDLYYENIKSTFNQLESYLDIEPVADLDIPDARPFSNQNLFVRYVKTLSLEIEHGNKNFPLAIKPCPEEFRHIYGFDAEQTIMSLPPAKCGFTLGEFPGDISFVIVRPDENTLEHMPEIRALFQSHPQILKFYIDDLALRHGFAERLIRTVKITAESLLNFSAASRRFASRLYNFIVAEIKIIKDTPPIYNNWKEAKQLVLELKKLGAHQRNS